MNIHELKKEIMGLEGGEAQILIYELLVEGKIDYMKLSEAYVWSLQKSAKEQNLIINKMGMWLSCYWQQHKKATEFLKAATAWMMIKSGCMRTARIEEDFKAYLKEHPYKEDESGFPITDIKSTP